MLKERTAIYETMESTPKHIEAEGGELLIQSSNGYTAIIPKNMAAFVKEHIKSGNHAAVDHYVKGLKEVKHKK